MSECLSPAPPGDDSTQSDHPIRLLIADDHALVRQGLCMILGTEPDMQVIGQAPDGAAAYALALELRPDVLIADVSMPRHSGIELAQLLCGEAPEIKTLIVSMHADPAVAREALASGALGYVTKMADVVVLLRAIRSVAAGQSYLDPALR